MANYFDDVVQKDVRQILSSKIDWSRLDNKTVLVTGANGMLATYMIYTLMGLNYINKFNISVIGLVRNESKARDRFRDLLDDNNFELLVQDVTNPIIFKGKVDYIIHAAGNASPKYILSDPVSIIKANTLGTLNVLEFAREKRVDNILYLSTREVYGNTPCNLSTIGENDYGIVDCKELRSCYPESKRLAESMFQSYFYQYGVPYNTVRLAHVYGPGMDIDSDGRIMSDLISDVVNKRNIVLKSDGTTVRAFCYITDAVVGMFMVMIEGARSEAYNIANETEPLMIKQVGEVLVELFGNRGINLVYDISAKNSDAYSKMKSSVLDTRKLESLGWKCDVCLKEGLLRTVKSFDDSDYLDSKFTVST